MGRLGAVIGHPQPAEPAIGLADGEDAALGAVRPLDRAGPRECGLARGPAIDPIVRLAHRRRRCAVALDRRLAAAGDEQRKNEEAAHAPSYHFRRSASSRRAIASPAIIASKRRSASGSLRTPSQAPAIACLSAVRLWGSLAGL